MNRRGAVVFKPAVTIKSIKAQEREGAAQKAKEEEEGAEEDEEEDSEEDESKRKLIAQYLNVSDMGVLAANKGVFTLGVSCWEELRASVPQ